MIYPATVATHVGLPETSSSRAFSLLHLCVGVTTKEMNMVSVYCLACEGEGEVVALFVHHANQTFRTPLLSCPSCDGGSNRGNGIREGEVLANYADKPMLIEQGYREIH